MLKPMGFIVRSGGRGNGIFPDPDAHFTGTAVRPGIIGNPGEYGGRSINRLSGAVEGVAPPGIAFPEAGGGDFDDAAQLFRFPFGAAFFRAYTSEAEKMEILPLSASSTQ